MWGQLAGRLVKVLTTQRRRPGIEPCTAIRAVEAIEPIENDIDKPVVTSNQAMVWHTLRKLNVEERPQGYGRLMSTG